MAAAEPCSPDGGDAGSALPAPTLDADRATKPGPAGVSWSSNLGATLRRAFLETGIERHAVPQADHGVEVRVHSGAGLLRRGLLRSRQAALLPAPAMPTRQEQPLLGVVVTGLGGSPAASLMTVGIPLTFPAGPFTPHSLRIAEDARRH